MKILLNFSFNDWKRFIAHSFYMFHKEVSAQNHIIFCFDKNLNLCWIPELIRRDQLSFNNFT